MSISEQISLETLVNQIENLTLNMENQGRQNQTQLQVQAPQQQIQILPFEVKPMDQIPYFTGENLSRFIKHCEHIISLYYDKRNQNINQNKAILNSIMTKISDECFSRISMYPCNTWDDLKQLLIRHFGDKRDAETLLYNLINLKQNRRRCVEYYSEFSEILDSLITKVDKSDQHFYMKLSVKHFIRNLDPLIGISVQNSSPKTLPEAYEIAQQIEDAYPEYFAKKRQNNLKQSQKPTKKLTYIPIINTGKQLPPSFPNNITPQTFPETNSIRFPSQPINIQSRPVKRNFPTNQQVFGKPKNVFAPNSSTSNKQPNPTPMSTSTNTRKTNKFRSHFQNNSNQPPNFVSEELFEVEDNDEEETQYQTENEDEFNFEEDDSNTEYEQNFQIPGPSDFKT